MKFKFIPKGTRFFAYIPSDTKLIECSVIGNVIYLVSSTPKLIINVLTTEGEMAINVDNLEMYESLQLALVNSSYAKGVHFLKSIEDFRNKRTTVDFSEMTVNLLSELCKPADTDLDKISFDFRGYKENDKGLYGEAHVYTIARLYGYYINKGTVSKTSEDAEFAFYDEDIKHFTPIDRNGQAIPLASEKNCFKTYEDAYAELLKSVTVVSLSGESLQAAEKVKKDSGLRKKIANWARKQELSIAELKALLTEIPTDNDN